MVTKLNRPLKRNNRLVFDLSDEELARFNERFSQYPMTNRSAFIRDAVLNNYIIINDDANLRDLVYEVNKIGANINQLARLAQQHKSMDVVDMDILKKHMQEIQKEIYHALMKHNSKR
ncbi:MAG: MobC family plasmid mobilization relaxosome protein [Psychroflexus sp.]|nr:MobC family plasmid mobilization relaxosome protein [Psychroflexus sp.]